MTNPKQGNSFNLLDVPGRLAFGPSNLVLPARITQTPGSANAKLTSGQVVKVVGSSYHVGNIIVDALEPEDTASPLGFICYSTVTNNHGPSSVISVAANGTVVWVTALAAITANQSVSGVSDDGTSDHGFGVVPATPAVTGDTPVPASQIIGKALDSGAIGDLIRVQVNVILI